eukprot:TRINITY_DN777911_c0_g1_i1.p1 TRINITY_DN777911_c0_g1~~TRINITY_DN777911_c0_g1_i1.p1  ORF type:complete len:374 (-),score=123.76 TRINITY_DN777911_c0_g1_i1:163-1284(-)
MSSYVKRKFFNKSEEETKPKVKAIDESKVKETMRILKCVPKAELHLHIEGTFEPELMFQIARRNGVKLEGTPEEERAKRDFKDLQDFLNLYYAGCDLLRTELDFYDLMFAYLKKASSENIVYTEMMFDPQTHTKRSIGFEVFMNGFKRAMKDAEHFFGIKSALIMCFLRDESAESAEETLEAAIPFKEDILAVGLDSAEINNRPEKFMEVFAEARKLGFFTVAHAGEEGDPTYITEAIDCLAVSRIDHGVRCLEDSNVVDLLRRYRIPLTVCPNSNHKLQVFPRYFDGKNCVRDLVDKDLCVTINSDDPAFFGGYLLDNFETTIRDCDLSTNEALELVCNGFEASLMGHQEKTELMNQARSYMVRKYSKSSSY